MPAPAVVDESRLKQGKLLNEEQKRKVQEFFYHHPHAVLYAGMDELPFPVIRSKEGKIFVLYATPKQLHYTPAETCKIAFQDEARSTTPKPLGGGASAIVVAAQNLEDDSWSAAKFQTTTRHEESVREGITREQHMLSLMNLSKGSATIEHVITTLDPNSVTTMTVMELATGKKLENLIEEDKRKSPDQKLRLEQMLNIMTQITTKTDDLVKKRLVQCDFNPKNVMCNIRSLTDIEIKLIDFGEVYPLNEKGEFIPRDKIPDTRGYGAPEISKGGYLVLKGCYSENTMAFSLGRTLGALLGVAENPTTFQGHNIIEKALHGVVYKLSQEDPNQRISPELAAEEIGIINDYHELLKKSGAIDSHKESSSLREHMRKTKESKGDLWRFNAELRSLEMRLFECQHKQSVYQQNILEKRLGKYINSLEAKDSKTKTHIKVMAGLQKEIQKLDPTQENFSVKLEALRTQAYQKHIQFENKIQEKQAKEANKVTERVTNWFRSSILHSVPRSASVSRDSEEISRGASIPLTSSPPLRLSPPLTPSPPSTSSPHSTASTASTPSPHSPHSTASPTSSVISTISSISSTNDNPPFNLDSLPAPVILSRTGNGKLSQPLQRNGRSPSPSNTVNKTFSAGFSPAFKMELEKRLADLNAKVPTSTEVGSNTPSKSPTSKPGGST